MKLLTPRTIPLFLSLMLLIAVLNAGAVLAQDAPSGVSDVVRVAVAPTLGSATYYIGLEEGVFAKYNIDLQLVELPQAANAETIALLLRGDIEVIQAFLNPGIINAVLRGENVRAVAASRKINPEGCSTWSFVVPAGQAENFDYAGLRGTTVGVPPGTPPYYLDLLLRLHGLTLADVTLENVPAPVRAEGVVNGALSLAWIPEPSLTPAHQLQGVEDLMSAADLVPNTDSGLVYFGPSMLERDDDLAVRFLSAYIEAGDLAAQEATERNVEIVSRGLELDPALLSEICWGMGLTDPQVDVDGALVYMTWLLEQGDIDGMLDIDLLYDPSYVLAALEGTGS
ncbi:MAG: ABC transporter substrate-binding protein [Chloroflexi bacterium]|nr:ABC transporter substrate-binding protein [Chloroflexota bacterium]